MEVNDQTAINSTLSSGASSGIFSSITSVLFYIFIPLLILVIIGFLLWILKKAISRFIFNLSLRKSAGSEQKAVLSIKLLRSNENKEDAMETFFRSLHRVLPNNVDISFEMVSAHQFLTFYVVVDKDYKQSVQSQLYGQFPDAEIDEVADYLKDLSVDAVIQDLYFKRSSVYPFQTYQQLKEDLLKSFSAALAKAEPDERAYLQICLKRVGSKIWERGFKNWYQQLFGQKINSEGNLSPLGAKLEDDLYVGKVRLIYVAKNRAVAYAKLNALKGLFKITKGDTNELKKKWFVLNKSSINAIKARLFQEGDFFSPAELATLYHFPHKEGSTSNIVETNSKRAPAPDDVPFEGLVEPKDVSFFAETNFRNDRRKFGIKRIDRRRHLYVVGKTGSGKSRLLQLLLMSDIASGQGCCLLDPHGDLANELLMYIPKERIKDVIYVNPSDRNFPIGFNPLESVNDYETRQHLATFFIAIFKKLFLATWNARMEHIVRYVVLALLETPDSNVLGIPRILTDPNYRQKVISQIQDPVIKNFFTNEFASWNQQYSAEAIIPIINKVGQFVANPVIRNMVGQKKNALDFDKFMNEGKIVLLNLSKGRLGEENTALLGSMFITKIQQAALSRAKIPEEQRRDFYFYVDEFQNFATDAFSLILSEARKYRLNLTLAHQYIAQLPEEVKATAFGNVGSLMVFPVGGDDAAYLAKEFTPVFTADDMINLNLREMYLKMSIDGKVSRPFSARTIDVPKPIADYSQEVLDNTRNTYARHRIEVENEIKAWTDATTSIAASGDNAENFPEPII